MASNADHQAIAHPGGNAMLVKGRNTCSDLVDSILTKSTLVKSTFVKSTLIKSTLIKPTTDRRY